MDKAKKIIENLICITFLFIFGITAWTYGKMAFTTNENYSEGKETYTSIEERFVSFQPSLQPTAQPNFSLPVPDISSIPISELNQEEIPLEVAPITVDFDALKEINDDIVGWIYSPFVDVSYPVAQTTDNQYYISVTYDKKYVNCGCIFMDYRNSPNMSDLNTIIYGHSMNNDTMFHPFQIYFKDKDFYKDHTYFYYLTPHGNYKMNIFACVIVPLNGPTYDLYNYKEDLTEYLTEMIDENLVKNDFDPEEITQCVAFSQCSHVYNGARYVLLCEPQKIG